jgi:hypothetical protein
MSLRISSTFAVLVALAACGAESPPPSGEKIDCAIGEASELMQACILEAVAGSEDFVIHHPDGGFRRFTRDPETGDIAAFDGAETVEMTSTYGGVVGFQVGADRYQFSLEPNAPPAP